MLESPDRARAARTALAALFLALCLPGPARGQQSYTLEELLRIGLRDSTGRVSPPSRERQLELRLTERGVDGERLLEPLLRLGELPAVHQLHALEVACDSGNVSSLREIEHG